MAGFSRTGFFSRSVILFLFQSGLYAQGADPPLSPYFQLPHHNAFVDYLIHSGRLRLLHPLNQPYYTANLYERLESSELTTDGPVSPASDPPKSATFDPPVLPNSEPPPAGSRLDDWRRMLLYDLRRFYYPSLKADGRAYWNLGVNGYYDIAVDQDKQWTKSRAEIFGVYSLPYLVLMNRTVTDQRFKDDPQYYGDTGEWIVGRVEDAYLMLRYRNIDLFGGRVSRNLGILEEPSLLLSDNPYSYDHFGLQLNTHRLHYMFITSRLNDLYAMDGKMEIPAWHQTKRYFSLQRAEINLHPNLAVALTEVVVYGGENQNFEAFYLNPANFYYVAQRNQDVKMNGLWGLEFFWKPLANLSLYSQLLIDDLIVNNEPGRDDRASHPDRLGVATKIVLADWPAHGMQLDLVYNRLGNWTYMSYRTWENYVYHMKSMGYPENSHESIRFAIRYLGRPPFIVDLSGIYRRHGDRDLNDVFGDRKEKFPSGIVEQQSSVNFAILYMPSPLIHTRLQFRYNSLRNEKNLADSNHDYFSILLTLYASLSYHFID